jgi:hypothetical protein
MLAGLLPPQMVSEAEATSCGSKHAGRQEVGQHTVQGNTAEALKKVLC